MKKTVMFVSLVLLALIIVGCPNNTPSTSSVNSITFERDSYTTLDSSSEHNATIINNKDPNELRDKIKELLLKIFPDGVIIFVETELGLSCEPATGEDWSITDAQWDELEEMIDNLEGEIDGQGYEAELERQDITGNIEVELDPIVEYPDDGTVTSIKIIDDTTGEVITDLSLLEKVKTHLDGFFVDDMAGTWGDAGIFTLTTEKEFLTEEEFETFEDDFEDQFEDEFILNEKEYEFGLEEPFNNILIIEVEVEDDSDDDD